MAHGIRPGLKQAINAHDAQQEPARRSQPAKKKKKATPETTARKVFAVERARQQAVIRRMETVQAETTVLAGQLQALLSDLAFVALLKQQGFTTLPRLLLNRLTGEEP